MADLKWARDMNDAEIVAELVALGKRWEALQSDTEGHGGSPGEGLSERMAELELEQKRRANASPRPDVAATAPPHLAAAKPWMMKRNAARDQTAAATAVPAPPALPDEVSRALDMLAVGDLSERDGHETAGIVRAWALAERARAEAGDKHAELLAREIRVVTGRRNAARLRAERAEAANALLAAGVEAQSISMALSLRDAAIARAEAAEARLAQMAAPATVDIVARAIYESHRGERAAMGVPERLWSTDAPWDTNPDELCEWERDEYRAEATAALRALGVEL